MFQMWKKSGAWFYHGVPKFVLPAQRSGVDSMDQLDGSLTPNWVASGHGRSSTRRSASPNGSDSPERRNRLDSTNGRRRLPATPDLSEYRANSPTPRWAQIEASRRGEKAGRIAPGSSRGNGRRRSSSSGEEDFEAEKRAPAVGPASASATSKSQHQWHGGVQRIVTRCRRFTESSSNSDDRSDEEPGGAGSERSPSLPSTPRGSVQTPSSTHDAGDGGAPTLVDTSDSKSIDSGGQSQLNIGTCMLQGSA